MSGRSITILFLLDFATMLALPSLDHASLPRVQVSRIATRVTPDALRQIRSGHPWVFESSISSIKRPGAVGDLAVVFNSQDRFAAIGLLDPKSPIRLRILHQGKPRKIDGEFWRERIAEALERRQPLVLRGDTTGYRVLNGENDGFPGLVLDRYDDTLVLKLYTAAWVPHLNDVVDAIEQLMSPKALVLRHARSIDIEDLHGLRNGFALLGTAPTKPVRFLEYGLSFEADVTKGPKTGHFLDQRDNRALVGSFARGKRVLDVCSSTGGFTVHAAAGGASQVVSVDISAPALAVAERNLELNAEAVAGCDYNSELGDAFEVLESLHVAKQNFDVVIIDPPAFSVREDQVAVALKGYARLTALGLAVLRPGGLLVQCSCSSRITPEMLLDTIETASQKVGRQLEVERQTEHGIDHPINYPEGRYLSAVFARAH